MPLHRIIELIARGAIALPLFAFGHGTEFLDARLDVIDGHILRLQITADYGGNPMIADENEARAALTEALHFSPDSGQPPVPLDELAPLAIAPSDAPDPESPMPPTAPDPSQPHQLLTGRWQWECTGASPSFTVPNSSRQSLLFWLHDPSGKEPRWSMLVPGDHTPVIPVKLPSPWRRWWWSIVAGLVVAAWVSVVLRKYRAQSQNETGR